DGRRHLIADADDVADGDPGRRFDVDHFHRRLRRLDDLAAFDMRILDFLVAVLELLVAGDRGRHDRTNRIIADGDVRGSRDAEPRRQRLVFVLDLDWRARRRHLPPGGHRERDGRFGRTLRAVRYGHVNLAI